MISIRPVSDLTNDPSILDNIEMGSPVYLTQEGRGNYVILDIRDYERMQASLQLMGELSKGERSGYESGWLTSEEVESELGL